MSLARWPAKECPVTAQQISEHGHGDEHDREHQVVSQADDDAPMHRCGGAANGDEAEDASSRGVAAHVARQHSQPRTICLCVDDFGLHAGVNEAALRLAAQDRVHAIGCLVGGEGWGMAWTRVLRHLASGGIDIGLHLDFTEFPLLPRSRRRLPSLIADSLLRRLDAAQVRAEIRAQLDTFEQMLGHGPAFVDGHQHVHQLAVIRQELLDELAARYRGHWPWLRSTRTAGGSLASGGRPWQTHLKARCIEMLGSRALDSMARRMGFAQNHCLLGVYDFEGGADRYRHLMAYWMASATDADLLMCHPGLRLHEGDPIAKARLSEYEVLASAGFAGMLRDADVTLLPMSQIVARHVLPT
jgi:chitin disaccharide deacetylase